MTCDAVTGSELEVRTNKAAVLIVRTPLCRSLTASPALSLPALLPLPLCVPRRPLYDVTLFPSPPPPAPFSLSFSMGNCISAQDRAEKARSDAIDRQLEEDSKKLRKECKILLLGKSLRLTLWALLSHSPIPPRHPCVPHRLTLL